MMKKKQLTVCLCLIVKNERKSSQIIFPKIPLKSVDRCIVIDGNSTDGTQEFFKNNNIPVFTQSIPGLGGATFEARKHCNSDAMIFFHPDGNEEAADIAKISQLLREGKEFVIPSRMIAGAHNEEDNQIFKPRKWFNQILATFVNFVWNEKNQYTSEIVQGFRGIQCSTFDSLKLEKFDLTIDFHMVIRALKQGVVITEFPTTEHDRLFGETNFSSFSTGWKEISMLFEEIFNLRTYTKLK